MIGGMKPSSSERSPWTSSPWSGSAATICVPVSLILEVAGVAHQRAAGAEARDERGDVAELFVDLGRGAVVVRDRVGLVAVLVRHVVRPEFFSAMSSAISTAPLMPLAPSL